MFGLALRHFATLDAIFTGIERTYKFVMKAANMDAPRIFAFVSCGLQNKTCMIISVHSQVVSSVWLQTLCIRCIKWRYRDSYMLGTYPFGLRTLIWIYPVVALALSCETRNSFRRLYNMWNGNARS